MTPRFGGGSTTPRGSRRCARGWRLPASVSTEPMQSFTVHALTPADLGQLRKLNELFAEAFHEREIYCSAPPHDGYIRDLLADRHTIVLVALADAAVA